MNPKQSVCIFGEVLFDMFFDGRRVLGGAPFNVAWHLQAFGLPPRLISRVGADEAGRAIRNAISDWGIDTRFLQTDNDRPTGQVEIRIKNGAPHYEIVPDCAYDFISPPKQAMKNCTLLYHGTLALRNPISAQTLATLKTHFKGILFVDVNLRAPWWTRDTVLDLIREAHWVKLNEAELEKLDSEKLPLITRAQAFQQKYALKGLIVTQGESGALAVTETLAPIQVKAAQARKIIDTVGAGDAFCAVLLLGITKNWPLKRTMERACAFAAGLLEKQGAIIDERAFYDTLKQDWQLKI